MTYPAVIAPDHFEIALTHSSSGAAGKARQLVTLNGGTQQKNLTMKGMGGTARVNDLRLLSLLGNTKSLILKGSPIKTEDIVSNDHNQRLDLDVLRAFGPDIAQTGAAAFVHEIASLSRDSSSAGKKAREAVTEIVTLKKLSALDPSLENKTRVQQSIIRSAENIAKIINEIQHVQGPKDIAAPAPAYIPAAISEFARNLISDIAITQKIPELAPVITAITSSIPATPAMAVDTAAPVQPPASPELAAAIADMMETANHDFSNMGPAEIQIRMIDLLAEKLPQIKISEIRAALNQSAPVRSFMTLRSAIPPVLTAAITDMMKTADQDFKGMKPTEIQVRMIDALAEKLPGIRIAEIRSALSLSAPVRSFITVQSTESVQSAQPAIIQPAVVSAVSAASVVPSVSAVAANIIIPQAASSIIEPARPATSPPLPAQAVIAPTHQPQTTRITPAAQIITPQEPVRIRTAIADPVVVKTNITPAIAPKGNEPAPAIRLSEQVKSNVTVNKPTEPRTTTATATATAKPTPANPTAPIPQPAELKIKPNPVEPVRPTPRNQPVAPKKDPIEAKADAKPEFKSPASPCGKPVCDCGRHFKNAAGSSDRPNNTPVIKFMDQNGKPVVLSDDYIRQQTDESNRIIKEAKLDTPRIKENEMERIMDRFKNKPTVTSQTGVSSEFGHVCKPGCAHHGGGVLDKALGTISPQKPAKNDSRAMNETKVEIKAPAPDDNW